MSTKVQETAALRSDLKNEVTVEEFTAKDIKAAAQHEQKTVRRRCVLLAACCCCC
jgi:hypothetical protein